MTGWTRENLRHLAHMLRFGRFPAATVYDSLGSAAVALAPGWLNLGLWEGPGDDDEAPAAVRRLVEVLAAELPSGGTVLDVGNGLGVQDPVIAEVARPGRLVALNITESQLRAGRSSLEEAGAHAVQGDAVRLPVATGAADGVISVEAAFHFSSRGAFFREARRVLRPGGVLTMSDVSTERRPRTVSEAAAGLLQMRFWGLRMSAIAPAEAIAGAARQAGLANVRIRRVGERVIGPALAVVRRRVERGLDVPASQEPPARLLLAASELLWRRRMIDYLLIRAEALS
ncbi:MAG: class I SAM-dependent methyltransferase [Actinomycetota bacterium]|nr:class I SAM-dependent methyltransferase [Actinomycetota bacterium]